MRRALPLVIAAVAVLAAAAALTLWLTRPRPTDTQQVEQAILGIKRGLEAHDAGAILRRISDAYNDGNQTKRDLVGWAVQGCRSPEEFRVLLEPPDIEVIGRAARVHVRVQFSMGGGGAQARPEPIALDILADLARTRRGWQVTSARGWEPALDAG
jgi:hypothetical protein